MTLRVDHGEPSGARRIECVADGTEFPVPGRRRLRLLRVVRMRLRGAVARFAREVPVIPFPLLGYDLRMAIRARDGPREPDRLGVLPPDPGRPPRLPSRCHGA